MTKRLMFAMSLLALIGASCDLAKSPPVRPNPAPPSDVVCGPNFGSCASGYTCIEKCGPPVVREGDAPPGYYCTTNEVASQPRMCPICLAATTMIQTPSGDVNVIEVQKGLKVWSQDALGNRIAVSVLEASKTPVPKTHQVVHLVLSDGREVWVSPSHPLTTGQPIVTLKAGDSYDHATVVSVAPEAYATGFTYDLLPDSPSGIYWADGIPLKSTLHR